MSFGMNYNYTLPVFVKDYRCFTVGAKSRSDLELGDKIILPESALVALTRQRVEYPMLFQLTNRQTEPKRVTHCSVIEFTAEEGVCYIPLWMMAQLGLYEGAVVNVKNVSLKKCEFVKIRPHRTAFTEISNPKAVLEHRLRSFSCLTKGDTLCIEYNGEKFYIDVLEVRPDGKACIIETDCEVDFAPPKDYKEPERMPPKKKPHLQNQSASATNTPTASSGGGAPAKSSSTSASKTDKNTKLSDEKYFKSNAYRIDGKAVPKTESAKKKRPLNAKERAKQAMALKNAVCIFIFAVIR